MTTHALGGLASSRWRLLHTRSWRTSWPPSWKYDVISYDLDAYLLEEQSRQFSPQTDLKWQSLRLEQEEQEENSDMGSQKIKTFKTFYNLDLDLDSTRIQVDALGHTSTPCILICFELPPPLPPRWFPSLTSPCWLCSSILCADDLDLS